MNEEAIFSEALKLGSRAEQAAFLDQACGGDLRMRQMVEGLLHAHDNPDSFLEVPAGGPAATGTAPITEGPGTHIGPYKLVEQIGEGGFGVVFMAEQQQPVRRKVALKVIKPGMDSKQIIARFEAERQALALMDHPNIAKVLDAGTVGPVCRTGPDASPADAAGPARQAGPTGRPYFVMELVKGLPITDFCDASRLTPKVRLKLFTDVCRAVQHAHQKGIIHRDIKPSNVLVTLQDGEPLVKMIDFGVAKALGQQLTNKTLVTGFAQVIGTPLYMSPEQTALSNADVDTRSDVYSLGVLLYELLTGTTPFAKERLREANYDEMRRIIVEEEPLKPSTRLSTLQKGALSTIAEQRGTESRKLSLEVNGELDLIVMKALEKDRSRRYESASALAADVQRYLADEPVEACPPSRRYRLQKLAHRHKVALATTSLVAVALLLGTAVSVWQAVDATDARQLADTQRNLAEGNATEAQRQAAKALESKQEAERQRNAVYQNLYYADMRLGLPDWNAGNLARLSNKLHGHVPKARAEDLRGWEWYYLLSLCHQEKRTLTADTGAAMGVAWSPDKRYVAAAIGYATKVWDTTSWQLLRTFSGSRSGVSWSPDSQWLAWGPAGTGNLSVYLWHVPSDKVKALPGHTGSIWTVAWSADGKLASAGMDNTIRVWEPATGSCIRVLKGVGGEIPSITWHPDGKLLASVGNWQGGLKIWDTVSGNILRGDVYAGEGFSVAWSPDGTQLALGANGQCRLYNTVDWSQAALWDAHPGPVKCVAWNPNGSRLASGGSDNQIKLWDPASTACIQTLRGHLDQVSSVAWEPGGRRLASAGADGTVKIWPLHLTQQPRRLEGLGGPLHAIAWCDELDTLRSLDTNKGLITHWNVATGERLGKTPVPRGRSGSFGSAGRLAAIAVAGKEPRLLVCDARSGKLIQTVNAGIADTVSFSPDAFQLAMLHGQGGTIEITDLRRNEVAFRWQTIPWPEGSWSPDGRLLAIAGFGDTRDPNSLWENWVHVFDVEKRQRILKLHQGTDGRAHAVTWSPNGQRLVSGYENGLAVVWEASSGHKVADARLHTAEITAQAWSPTDRRVASGSRDRTVRIWDPTTGEELLRFDISNGFVFELKWSADGRRLAASCTDGSILIWDASTGYDYVHSAAYTLEEFRAYRRQAQELWGMGRTEDAIGLLKQTVAKSKAQLGPDHSDTVTSIAELALTYERAGRRREADAVLGQALEKPNARLEHVALAILRERSQLFAAAQSRQSAQLFAAAVRYYSEAFAAEPKLANDIYRSNRYNAACAAALAGCGQGKDAATLEDGERASLRRQALAWLRADLAARRSLLDKDRGEVRFLVQPMLPHWQIDPDFNGVRGADALAKLPEVERQEWRKLWQEVEELTKRAGEK